MVWLCLKIIKNDRMKQRLSPGSGNVKCVSRLKIMSHGDVFEIEKSVEKFAVWFLMNGDII